MEEKIEIGDKFYTSGMIASFRAAY